jgi:hypothetical protein
MRVLAIVLIVLGVIGLVSGGISYTRREKVLDVGSVELSRDQHERIPVPPVAGALCLVAGIAILFIRPR